MSDWEPVPTAGGNDGWEPVPSAAPKETIGGKIGKLYDQFGQGKNDVIANTAGAPVDAIAFLLKHAGLPINKPIGGSESLKDVFNYGGSIPSRVSDAISQRSLAPLDAPATPAPAPTDLPEKIARGVGEGVGGALSTIVPAAGVARLAPAGGVIQGVADTLATQPGAQTAMGAVGGGVTEATGKPEYGLAASLAVPGVNSLARGVVSPVKNVLTAQEQKLVGAAQREGIPLTPAQATGSPTLRAVEETATQLPLANGPMKEALRGQREAFNSAVLKRAGIDAKDASPETLNKAFTSAGQTFDDLATRTNIKIDPQFVTDVKNVENNYGRRLDTNVAPIFKSYMEDLAPVLQAAITPGANPAVAGTAYAKIRTDIGRTIRANGKNPDLQNALGELQNAFDDAMERSAPGALKGEWQDARRQYQALMTVDKAMQGGTAATRSTADIPFGGLKTAVASGDRAGYSRGRGQLNELSRVGDYLADKIPNSGTVTRGMVANPLNWPLLAGGGIASKAYNSRVGQSYLTNQLAGETNFGALYGSEAARRARAKGTNALSQRDEQ